VNPSEAPPIIISALTAGEIVAARSPPGKASGVLCRMELDGGGGRVGREIQIRNERVGRSMEGVVRGSCKDGEDEPDSRWWPCISATPPSRVLLPALAVSQAR
jgi:hypothetical protein